MTCIWYKLVLNDVNYSSNLQFLVIQVLAIFGIYNRLLI